MAAARGFFALPVISLFLFPRAVCCCFDKGTCSKFVRYCSGSYLRSNLKDLLLSPFNISFRAKPWHRFGKTIRFPQFVWTKHAYYCLSSLDLHSDINMTIFMDVSSNPGPSNLSSLFSSGLIFLYLNSRSLKASVSYGDDSATSKVCKITLLQQLVYRGDYDVVCVCETWLNNSDCELLFGYSIYRTDREGRVGGGVLLAIRNGQQAFHRLDLEKENIELLVIENDEL